MTHLLYLIALLSTGNSALVEEGHEHDWRLVVGIEDGDLFLDNNWSGEFQQDGRTFPLRLFRMKNVKDEEIGEADIKLAFDCPNRQLGIKAGSALDPESGDPRIIEMEMVAFDFIEGSPSDEDELVLETVCGKASAQ